MKMSAAFPLQTFLLFKILFYLISASVNGSPHSGQNFAESGNSIPQFEQHLFFSNLQPHSGQKLLLSATSGLQFKHLIVI